MRIGNAGLALIKEFEGLQLRSYQDQAGVWTVGYGHTLSAVPGLTITEERADELLREDVANAELAVNRFVKVPLDQNQFDALVSLTFNIGEGAFRQSTLLEKLNSGDYDAVSPQIKRWNKVTINGVLQVSNGLVRRRNAEARLWAFQLLEDPKPLKKSQTIWGSIVAIVSGVAEEIVREVEPIRDALDGVGVPSDWLRWVLLAGAVIGSAVAIYARVRDRTQTGR